MNDLREAVSGNIGDLYPRSTIARDEEILALWCAGFDTLKIARAIGVPESDVYNRLPKVLERRKQDRSWHLHELPRVRDCRG